MVKMINDNFMVCVDCAQAIVNDDFSEPSLRYADNGDLDQRIGEIVFGIADAGGRACLGDSSRNEEFTTRPCDCCESALAGERHHFTVLG